MTSQGSPAPEAGSAGPLPADATPEQINAMLNARYGLKKNRDRRTTVVVATLATALAGYLWWAFFVGANAPVTATLLTYEITSASAVNVVFETTTRAGLSGPFTCVIRAQDAQRIDVGYALYDVRASNGAKRTNEWTLTTRKAAQFVEVLACAPGRERPAAAPAPQFPPGVKAPDQVSPGRAP